MPAPQIAGVNLTTNPPHNTRIEVNIGALSVLFSYGSPIGFSYHDGPYVREGLNRFQQRHVNQWRRFDTQTKVPFTEFHLGFLSALNQETEQQINNLIANPPGEMTMPDSINDARLDAIDDELEELDEEEGDDDDLDDDELDEDDDLDDEDDDDLDEDEDDDELLDDDDEEEDEPAPLKDGEY